ncbi:sorting nexin-11 isoform X2 [Siniperca chuatsi]|uniref:sorting nexin-11 isoform X2 n=1 Tax=Siniperca chuatsi TaxID=119488 RepID=UPI001CE10A53|nr:sorting nexin-11 isoform X2 [Siniperca chuatsi]XP_044035994.1 sorting nexin-11 isoform X2 [Siniperca chuatsi]
MWIIKYSYMPVPDLPGKSFFSFSNEDFLERRRKGLQAFLDKVLHMTVCLSDSQLHLFLQTQLPVGHIQDCVQGHTPYSVTDAILTYASSNRGFAQAQEEDSIKEPSLTVSYESMESPTPHQPNIQTKEIFSPELFSCSDSDPLVGLLELCDQDTAELQYKEKSSIMVLQKNNHLEAIVEGRGPTEATFFIADSPDDPESLSLPEQSQQRSCQIQTPVLVHSPMGTGFEENCGVDSVFEECSLREESVRTVPHPNTEEEADQRESSEEESIEKVDSEPEKCVDSVAILDFKDSDAKSQEVVLEDVCSEKQVLENRVISEVNGLEHVGSTESHVEDVSCLEEFKTSDGQNNEKSDDSESKQATPLESEIHEATDNVHSVPEVENGGDDTVQQMDQKQVEQEVDLVGTRDESDEDSHSLPSSNESIVTVSDEESICDETEDSIRAANGYMKTSPEEVTHRSQVEASSRNILDLHMNGCPVEKEDIPAQEDEDLRYMTDIGDLSKSLTLNSTVTGGDLTESSDFSILETSCTPGLDDSKCTEQETLSSLSLDA